MDQGTLNPHLGLELTTTPDKPKQKRQTNTEVDRRGDVGAVQLSTPRLKKIKNQTKLNKNMKENLNQAFKGMREQKLLARQNFTDCQSCACAKLPEREEAEKRGLVGYAFYHRQDREYLERSGKLYIAFGTFGQKDGETDQEQAERAVEVGEIIRHQLERNGFAVVWDGSANHRIFATARIEL